MALRGNLRDFSLPDVFQLVTFSRKTGVLRIVRTDAAQGSVWFREGEVFFASSNWHSAPLGERLVSAQRITAQALKKALGLRANEPQEGRRLGQILVDEGYITDKVLETFVQDQIQDTIFDLMRWDDGEFDFESMPDVVDEDIGLTVSIENVVMEGSRRLEEWSRIKKKIPSTDVVFKMATAPGEGTFEISLKPIEWQLLLLIDRTRSVADLAIETERTDFEVARIVYGLFSAGLLEFATDAEIAQNRAEREQREARVAKIEAEKRAAEQASRLRAEAAAEKQRAEEAQKAALESAQALRAETEKAVQESARLEAEAAIEAEAEAQAAADAPMESPDEPLVPVEVPEFLAAGTIAPSVDDQAALDEFMGAVLSSPDEKTTSTTDSMSSTPYVPVEEPAFITAGYRDSSEDGAEGEPSVEEILGLAAAPMAETTLSSVDAAMSLDQSEVTEAPDAAGRTETLPETPATDSFTLIAPIEETVVAPVPIQLDQTRTVQEIDWAEFAYSTPSPGSVDVSVVADAPAEESTEEQGGIGFEKGLLALGLGELPADLMAPLPTEQESPAVEARPIEAAPVVLPASPTDVKDEDDDSIPVVVEPMSTVGMWTEEGPSTSPETLGNGSSDSTMEDLQDWVVPDQDLEYELTIIPTVPESDDMQVPEGMDFSALIESLDVDADDDESRAGLPSGFDAELLRDEASALAGGVISTDAFLEDIGIDDLGLAGGMTDELSALTGVHRRNASRPQASVNTLPEEGAGLLQRDKRVDKETLLRIIDGIQKL